MMAFLTVEFSHCMLDILRVSIAYALASFMVGISSAFG